MDQAKKGLDKLYKVIAVDDEPHVLEGLSEMIDWHQYGFELVSTHDMSHEALETIIERPVDLLLTDVRMPDMDGLTLIDMAKKCRPDLEILVMSGYRDFEYVKAAMSLGADGYLVKPIMDDDLSPALQKIRNKIKERHELSRMDQMASLVHIKNQIMGKEHMDNNRNQKNMRMTPWTLLLVQSNEGEFQVARLEDLLLNSTEHIGILLKTGGDQRLYLMAEEPSILEDKWHDEGLGIWHLEEVISINPQLIKEQSQSIWSKYQCASEEMLLYSQLSQDELKEKMVDAINRLDDKHIKGLFKGYLWQMDQSGLKVESALQNMLLFYQQVLVEVLGNEEDERFINEMLYMPRILEVESVTAIYTVFFRRWNKLKNYVAHKQEQGREGLKAVINDYLKEYYREGLTIKGLAELVHMNPVYLGQKIQAMYGENFNKVLHRYRVERAAKLLLRRTGLSLEEVALAVGYNQYALFLKYFKEFYEMTPGEYMRTL